MKMSDVFKLPVEVGGTFLEGGDYFVQVYMIEDGEGQDFNTECQIEHACHAINNYDKLLEENNTLREALRKSHDILKFNAAYNTMPLFRQNLDLLKVKGQKDAE